jgi:hypothetical protein
MNASLEAQHVARHKRFLAFILQPRFGKAALIVLGILPALILLADIRRNAVNVPFMDDWQFVPLLEKAKDGTLSSGALGASRRTPPASSPGDHHRSDVCHGWRLSRPIPHYLRRCGGDFKLPAVADA